MADRELTQLYKECVKQGATPKQKDIIEREISFDGSHDIIPPVNYSISRDYNMIYTLSDPIVFHGRDELYRPSSYLQKSLDELLERDQQRKKDGFLPKIKIKRIISPSKDGGKFIVVPVTTEEKFVHDEELPMDPPDDSNNIIMAWSTGGSGDGDIGDVIAEEPIEHGGGAGAGQGGDEEGEHSLDSNAYDIGKMLTEQFQLPNLMDKKKKVFKRYKYDLTDRNRGSGQFLNKKETLKQIIKTNIGLGRIKQGETPDPKKLLISPRDKVYDILSREKEYESKALAFFVRDYSGSMQGTPADTIATQHLMIYAWLMYQYQSMVDSRFIVHDTKAKEVPDFHTYYNLNVAGGTDVSSAFTLVNQIVSDENLAQDYNIYIFYGTDGEDWDDSGKEALSQIKDMLGYANRVGITIAENGYSASGTSHVELYIRRSGILENHRDLIRLDTIKYGEATQDNITNGIKRLVS